MKNFSILRSVRTTSLTYLTALASVCVMLFCTAPAWSGQPVPELTVVERPAPGAQISNRPETPKGNRDRSDKGFIGEGRMTADNHFTLEPEAATNSYKKGKGERLIGGDGQNKSLSALQAERRLGGLFVEDHIAEQKRAKNKLIKVK